MDFKEDSSRLAAIPKTTSRNLSSSSSAFFSANQSPFFSPRSPTSQLPKTSEHPCHDASIHMAPMILSSSAGVLDNESLVKARFDLTRVNPLAITSASSDPQRLDTISSSACISDCTPTSYGHGQQRHIGRVYSRPTTKQKVPVKMNETSVNSTSTSSCSNRLRSCDVYIGFHGRKPLLLRFTNWLRAELEAQGLSSFVTDRARCRSSRKHAFFEKVMDACMFGVVILTRKSFGNPYTIEELRFFSSKKNLVPIYFDLGVEDCRVRDIIEKRGELWEKYGGELWLLYGGVENEWREAVSALSRIDEWKLEAYDGRWRDCILGAVTLLALRLGKRSVVDRLTKWRELADKEEFPFPQNENFVGRKKELSELEFRLFGDVSGDAEKEYFDLKARPRKKNLTIGWGRSNSMEEKRKARKGEKSKKDKEPVVWKELDKEIEMQNNNGFSQTQQQLPKLRNTGKHHARRKRSIKVVYGKGIACVSGESGIGKTELLLEFAHRFHQRYKMVLWIGGESRYIRQNYLNTWPFLEVEVGVENSVGKSRLKSFEEQEEAAIARVRKELMNNIPFLVIIDNVESEKDWWDRKLIMDLLPRFGGETHVIISTRLSSVMNLEPLKLSFLSEFEAVSLMQGSVKDLPIAEIDALRVIEEKLGRLTLGLAIVGSIMSELPINPGRLLDTINRMPSRDLTLSGREDHSLRQNSFLLQLLEVCFSIFDHADGPRSLATRMVLASGWFAPAPIPLYLLSMAANKIPEKHYRRRPLWKDFLCSFTCGSTSSYSRRSEAEASTLLLRFNMARPCMTEGYIHFNPLIKLYARKRGNIGVSQAMVQSVVSRGSINLHSEHIWAACFLLFRFGQEPAIVELNVQDFLLMIKQVILPLAIRTFMTYSRCRAALELLRVCTNALEAADQEFVTPVEKWLDKSICWRPIPTNAQLNPCLWQELALTRATVLEIRAKLMMRGGQFDIGDDLIRKAIFIRTSISGENHPDTISARETLAKITRLLANVQSHMSP